MSSDWEPLETGTHQDHVIAHVIGATVLGYFVLDEAAHLILDIGFIWTIFLDGEMGLVLRTMAISELNADADTRAELRADAEALDSVGEAAKLTRIEAAPSGCLITEVGLYALEDRRRVLVTGEDASLKVETRLSVPEVRVAPI
ncbi:MAG TPA: hypothetical protein VJT09_19845 [Pyrinomonadaceae bacterium]|nr:hypothetical protein [Pyrinomonadaceae bacterium]